MVLDIALGIVLGAVLLFVLVFIVPMILILVIGPIIALFEKEPKPRTVKDIQDTYRTDRSALP